MTNRCTNKLIKLQFTGTKLDIKISTKLLNSNIQFNKIMELANFFEISISTASRFVKRLEYPSFQHFLHDYQETFDENVKNSNIEYEKIAKKIVSKIKGEIFIISSRRAKSIAKYIHERLNDGKIKNHYFSESQNNLNKFLEKITCKNTIFLITLSSYSNTISKTFEIISNFKIRNRPEIIIFTAAKWMKIFTKYDHISLGSLTNKKYNLNKWADYNNVMLSFMTIITLILNKLKQN